MLLCIHIVIKRLWVLRQLKEEVANSALRSRILIGDVGTLASRYIWNNLVLITPGRGSKSHGELLLKVQIP